MLSLQKKFYSHRKKNRLSYRLLIYILLCSTLLAFLGAGVLLFWDFKNDVKNIEKGIGTIRAAYLDSLASSLWKLDKEQINIQLDGIMTLPDIEYASITEIVAGKQEAAFIRGEASGDYPIFHEFDLYYKDNLVGKLEVAAGLDRVYQRLFVKFLVILSSQAIQILLVSICILVIVHFLIVRHLNTMSHYAHGLDLDNLDSELVLGGERGRHGNEDSLDYLANTLNRMCGNISKQLQEKKKAQEELQVLNEELEQRIKKRTAQMEEAKNSAVQAAREAEAANQSKSTFLANMSHEIRTPMNAILGFTEILAGVVTDAQQKQYLGSIQTSGKTLLTLINDILDLSKVEAGKLELEYAPVDPRGVFREMEPVFSQKMAEKNLDFSVAFGSELPQALILDEARVRQVLTNLIGNAVKFTDQGHVKLSVRNLHPEEDRSKLDLLIEVEDTGKGIPKDQKERIFGAFEQQRGQRISEYGGTGLGLAISKRLVGLMGGEIQVTSEEGRGSTFQVILREVPVAAVTKLETQAAPAIDVNAVTFEPATLLVTDDIEVNRNLIRGYLEQYGLNLLEAENGMEAVEVTKRHHPDVVLMDMKMPVMSGYEATRMIKGDTEIRDIPVVALTASAMEPAVIEMKALCDGYLRKPVSKADLVGELARLLPHSLAETGSQGPSPSREEAKAWSSEDLDAEARAGLAELVEILESRQDSCETLRHTMPIKDIKAFAQQNRETGTQYRYPPLVSWGERLGGQAEMFDLEGLSATLASYADLIQSIKSITPV
ncbi:MAG: ATP-binding protein [Amphritea sp.]